MQKNMFKYDSLDSALKSTFSKIRLVLKKEKSNSLLLIFPLVTLISNFRRLYRTLQSIHSVKGFVTGGFRPLNALNSYFYKTQSHNVDKYGWKARSTTVGDGDFRISNWWQITSFSSSIFDKYGYFSIFLAMLLLLMSVCMIVFLETNSFLISVMVGLVIFLSTYFYNNCFVLQNYNAQGWALVPAFLYCLLLKEYVFASIVIFIASFLSFTAIFILTFIASIFAIAETEPFGILVCVPAVVKISTHFLRSPHPWNDFLKMAIAIGFVRDSDLIKPHLRRKFSHYIRFIEYLYFELSWFLFGICLIYLGAFSGAALVFGVVALNVANGTFVRFADEQSLQMAMLSLGAVLLALHFHPLLLFAFCIPIFAPPLVFNIFEKNDTLFHPVSYKLFDLVKIESLLEDFLSEVPAGSKIGLNLSDPQGDYFNVYGGSRSLFEPLFYVANRLDIHVHPDWYAVYQANLEERFSHLWCENQSSAELKKQGYDYMVLFSDENASHALASIDWNDIDSFDISDFMLCSDVHSRWKLVKI